VSAALKGFARLGVCAITTFQVALTSFSLYLLRVTWFITQSTIGGGMVKLKVGISFKWLSVIFFHSYVRSIAPKMTF
jgi:hypothetical protein